MVSQRATAVAQHSTFGSLKAAPPCQHAPSQQAKSVPNHKRSLLLLSSFAALVQAPLAPDSRSWHQHTDPLPEQGVMQDQFRGVLGAAGPIRNTAMLSSQQELQSRRRASGKGFLWFVRRFFLSDQELQLSDLRPLQPLLDPHALATASWHAVEPLYEEHADTCMSDNSLRALLPPAWHMMLLSDGSVTRHLQLLTGTKTAADCFEMRHVGHSTQGLPAGTELIEGPRVQRQ
ncbi:hypothetical protein KFL_004910010, partial [Klebsormidium nitens]